MSEFISTFMGKNTSGSSTTTSSGGSNDIGSSYDLLRYIAFHLEGAEQKSKARSCSLFLTTALAIAFATLICFFIRSCVGAVLAVHICILKMSMAVSAAK